MNTIDDKRKFMMACGQPVRTTPGTPTIEERKLNLALILEEVVELADAYGLRGTFNEMMVNKSGVEAAIGLDCGEEVVYLEYGLVTDTLDYDPVETLDALCDIRVVCDGPILSSGLQDVFPAAMAEVAASNMSKFTTDGRKALHFAAEKEANAELNNGFWCVKNEAGKVQKPSWHFKPNLAQFFQGDKS